jgi:hypothetical protein
VARCDRCGYSSRRATPFHIVVGSTPKRAQGRVTLGGDLCERCAPVLTSLRRVRSSALVALALSVAGGVAGMLASGPTAGALAASPPFAMFLVLVVLIASWHRRTAKYILGTKLIEKITAGLPETGGSQPWRRVRVFFGSPRAGVRIAELGRSVR